MEISKQEYQKFVQDRAKSSPIAKNCALAFAIGGGICVLGQAVMDAWTAFGLGKTDAGTATSITLVFLSVLLTGLNLYNKLGRYGGAGTLVPITGFANAVASPAIDFKPDHRHGGQDVHRRRPGDRLRRSRQRGLRRDPDAGANAAVSAPLWRTGKAPSSTGVLFRSGGPGFRRKAGIARTCKNFFKKLKLHIDRTR